MAVGPLRFEIRVKPGARSTSVGGTHGGAAAGPLNVMVLEKAVDGRANEAALGLLATVLGVRKRQLRIVSGRTHRTKLIEVDVPADEVEAVSERLAHLRST